MPVKSTELVAKHDPHWPQRRTVVGIIAATLIAIVSAFGIRTVLAPQPLSVQLRDNGSQGTGRNGENRAGKGRRPRHRIFHRHR